MTNFHKVRGNGAILYFPETFPRDSRYRGSEGYVVDLDVPGERVFCEGQMHKLEPAPEAKAAAEITHPIALRAMREEAKRAAAAAAEAASEEKEGAVVGAATGSDTDQQGESLEVTRPARAKKAS